MLREYMKVIYDSNIRAVCVESRPHPDFMGAAWWHDMDIILDEARTRGMKVWILGRQPFSDRILQRKNGGEAGCVLQMVFDV